MNKEKLETITDKLHARSDAKLRKYCEERFGDLFDMCGKHSVESITIEKSSKLSQQMKNVGTQKTTVWHGSVWELARETLFEMLKVKWRNREIEEFMGNLESMRDDIDHIEGELDR